MNGACYCFCVQAEILIDLVPSFRAQGGWEDDESVEAAAKRETVEEAGVRGELEEPMLGPLSFKSAKHGNAACIASLYVMHVAEELAVWPEHNERKRAWLSLKDASQLCRHPWMRDALLEWVVRKGWSPASLQAPCSSERSTFSPQQSLTPQASSDPDA